MKKLKKIKLQSQNFLDASEMKHIVGGQYNYKLPCGTGTDAGVCNGVCAPALEGGEMASRTCYRAYDSTGYHCKCLF